MRKSTKSALLAGAVLLCAACSPKASISGTIESYPAGELTVMQLDINRFSVLDTISTDANGRFSYKTEVAKGDPEFIYIFKGESKIASLLVAQGDKLSVSADTLGNYTVEGSTEAVRFAQADKAADAFAAKMSEAVGDGPAMAKVYIDHYRECVRFVLEDPFSLSNVPVLFERMGGDATPIFNQSTDAIIFRSTADSLETVYPDSRYVKALRAETERRLRMLDLESRINTAQEIGYPDIVMSDIDGKLSALSAVEAKVVLVHFWDCTNASQKMMNLDNLMPLYERYHNKGFEIFAVCLTPDKAAWGSVVKSQKLPWINVCDGRGAASPVVSTYNVTETPNSFLIVDGELSGEKISGSDGLNRVLGRLLGR